MAIVYKFDVVEALKKAGYSSYKIYKDRIFGNATMTKYRQHGPLNFNDLNKICALLNCQPGDLLEYVPDTPAQSNANNP
ncbi:MAG: helix-turn-helix transcriptional regulator [Oscillospiraceae bacterium]|nr:helix-turn-helix transcriptional regulator [Oscillospiraceae bacterium]